MKSSINSIYEPKKTVIVVGSTTLYLGSVIEHAFWFILIQITLIVWGYLFNTITAGYMTMYYFVTAINIGVLLLAVYETRKYGHPRLKK